MRWDEMNWMLIMFLDGRSPLPHTYIVLLSCFLPFGSAHGHLFSYLFICMGVVVVSCGAYPQAAQAKGPSQWTRRGHSCCLLGLHSWVPDCWGSGAGWECKQRSQGEEDHTQASAAGYQGGRGARHTHQGHHCWWWRHPSHSQVPHQQNLQRMRALCALLI